MDACGGPQGESGRAEVPFASSQLPPGGLSDALLDTLG